MNYLADIWIIGTLSIMALLIFIFVAVKQEMAWDQFKKEHNCQIVSKSTGNSGPTISIEGKTGWKCDDGVTYFR